MELASEDLPTLFRDADRDSIAGQRQYIRATATRLWAVLLVVPMWWLAGELLDLLYGAGVIR